MSAAILKLFLVISLVLQAILWSNSRHANVDALQPVTNTGHLIRRSFTTGSLEPAVYNDFKTKCQPKAIPILEQCDYVNKYCDKSNTLLGIRYIHNYYCKAASIRPAYFLALVLWLIFLFSTLGIGASDFFCPNLATIASVLGLDENVAGVTFLAFGNGSPDVFSTFSAMKANSGSLAIGELLGAASFIISVVVGSMSIIKPFRVNKAPFIRDIGFFTTAISLLLAILIDGRIRAWEAGLLVLLYVVYVVVVVIGSYWERRNERLRLKDERIRSQYGQEAVEDEAPSVLRPYRDEPFEPYRDDEPPATLAPLPLSKRMRAQSNPGRLPSQPVGVRPDSMTLSLHIPPVRPRRSSFRGHPHANHPQNLPSFSLLGALEFRTVVNSLKRQSTASSLDVFETPITPYAGGHYHNPMVHSTTLRSPHSGNGEHEGESNPWESALGVPLDERRGEELTDSVGQLPTGLHPWSRVPRKSPVPSISIQTEDGEDISSPVASSALSPVERRIPLTKRQRLRAIAWEAFNIFFPTLENFKDKSVLGMVASLFATPAVLALTLTLPVVVTPREDPVLMEKDENGHGSHVPTGQLVDFEEEGVERVLIAEDVVEEEINGLPFNKWLMALQCICGPLFCVLVLFGTPAEAKLQLLAAGVGGLVTAILVLIFANDGKDPMARVARCSMGFFVAIVWIMAIADEVVQLLQTFGTLFGLSDAIIGLTVFAVGNSLADFVANITVAAFAPIMGFSACFGGPMLNILLGVGLAGSYVIRQTGEDYLVHFSTTLLVSSIGLLALLLATMIFVPWNDFTLSRNWGIFLIFSYVVIMTINIVVEVRQEG